MASLDQMTELIQLMNELGVDNTVDRTDIYSGNKDYAGIVPYNAVPKDFYKLIDYAKKGVFAIQMPYIKASNPEEEAAGKNLLYAYSDKEVDKEIIPTSFKGYTVEYTDNHNLAEFDNDKVTNYCKVIGTKCGDMATNDPSQVPVKWIYSKGSTTDHRVPSPQLIATNTIGANGMECAKCIEGGFNQRMNIKGDKKIWCKEAGIATIYITHLGVLNKKTKTVVYTAVKDIFFISKWDLDAQRLDQVKRMDFLPCYMALSSTYIQGSFADPAKGLDAVEGFGTFFEKIRKSSAASGYFNVMQYKVEVSVVPRDPVNQLSFIADSEFSTTELTAIINHWKLNKPAFEKVEVPFNVFTTTLKGATPEAAANSENTEQKTNIDDF